MGRPPALVVQLSDLHLLSGAEDEGAIADGLVEALRTEIERRRGSIDALKRAAIPSEVPTG